MPNWVYNGLTIEGNPESVTKLVNQMNQPFHILHDSWNMKTHQQEKKDVLYSNPVFAFWNIIKPEDIDSYQKQPEYKPNASIEDMMKHDGDDWYSWNNRNWGVKWDVAVSNGDEHPDTYMEGPVPNGENLVVYYKFNTAWGIAEPALSELSSQYPDLLFTLSYEEETGWGGELEILRGKFISNSQYTSKCNECDSYDTLEYCEDCANDVCSDCGYGKENDCETHKENA